MKRREFLVRSVGAGVASGLAPVAAFAGGSHAGAPARPESASAAPRRQAWFERLINDEFTLHREGQDPVRARLIAVRGVPGSPRHEQFTVVFRVTGADSEGGLFEAEHPTAGRFPIRFSPCADLGSRLTWQAHYSLLS